MSTSTRTWLRRHGWWVSFIVVLVVALAFSLVVGDYVASLRQPTEAGRSTTGEWADLSEFGFRARLDEVALVTPQPGEMDPVQGGPRGASLLRVRMSIEPLVDEEETIGCSWRLFNGGGEQLTLTEYGVEGPRSTECTFIPDEETGTSDEATRDKGVPFPSQVVFVVAPAAIDSFSLRLVSEFGASSSYWTFNP